MKKKPASVIAAALGVLACAAAFGAIKAGPSAIHSNASTIVAAAAGRDMGGLTGEKVIRMSAKNFAFSPGTITVKKGVPVVLELTSEDRVHGFKLPEFKVRSDIKPGAVTRVSFTPDKTGEFSFSCDVFCGDGHEQMDGTLIVTE